MHAPYDAAQPVVIAAHLPAEPPQSIFRNIIFSYIASMCLWCCPCGLAAFITASKTVQICLVFEVSFGYGLRSTKTPDCWKVTRRQSIERKSAIFSYKSSPGDEIPERDVAYLFSVYLFTTELRS